MDLKTFITIIAAAIGILGSFSVGAIWILSITSKFSNRAYSLERDVSDGKERLLKLENRTSFESLEDIIARVFSTLIHSEDFKKVNSQVIRDTLLHIEKNKTASEASALHEILAELKDIKTKKTLKTKKH